MQGHHKKTLRELANSISPALRKKLTNAVLLELAYGRVPDPRTTFRAAAVSAFIEFDDAKAKKEAEDLLVNLGAGKEIPYLRIVAAMTPKMIQRLTDLAMVQRIVREGSKCLFEATAVLFALHEHSSPEKKCAMDILCLMRNRNLNAAFDALAESGFLEKKDQLKITELQLVGLPEHAARYHKPFSTQQELRLALQDMLGKKPSRKAQPEEPKPEIDKPDNLRSKPPEEKKALTWEEREEIPLVDDAAEIRNLDLYGKQVGRAMMYRIICVFCFRIIGQKALIGDKYANSDTIKSNVLRLVKGDRLFIRFFERCWKEMVSNSAIITKKINGSAGVASLAVSPAGIRDETIRESLAWALAQNRRYST